MGRNLKKKLRMEWEGARKEHKKCWETTNLGTYGRNRGRNWE